MASLTPAEKRLDKVFSTYIRMRDTKTKGDVRWGKCCTCGGIKHYADLDAGHYCDRSNKCTRWDEQNVHAQCQSCNRFAGGRQDDYAIFLMEKYGKEILEELHRRKWQVCKFSDLLIEEMIKDYKARIKTL
jgi:5-methylcytosine-specific restriction endonuclease McrA